MQALILWAALFAAASAQDPTAADVAPTFEVASVRPNAGTDTAWSYFAQGERFTMTNVTLRRIIALAYGIPLQLEQFGLRARPEVRQGPVYALVVARSGALGPELRPSKHNCSRLKAAWLENKTPSSEKIRPLDAGNRPLCVTRPGDEQPPGAVRLRNAGTISDLIMTTQGFLDRPLLDATNLSGNFEWQLTFSTPNARPREGSDLRSILVAMPEQLGLRFEQRTGPIDYLLIESVGMPTQN